MDRAVGVMLNRRNVVCAFEPRKPQMGMIERIVWENWVESHIGAYERIGENVPIWFQPPGDDDSAEWSNTVRKSHPDYRIDAILGSGDHVDLVEVKEIGNLTAIGQLIAYSYLFTRTYWGMKDVGMILVAARVPDPIRFVCERLGINVQTADDSIAERIRGIRAGKAAQSRAELGYRKGMELVEGRSDVDMSETG